jgi:hypothetical protein
MWKHNRKENEEKESQTYVSESFPFIEKKEGEKKKASSEKCFQQ